VEWPGPQYGHRIDGYEQWITEEFGDEHALRLFIPILKAHLKIGRNERCPCDSGLKFKKCHNKRSSTFVAALRRQYCSGCLPRRLWRRFCQ
jgi:hypothetical protein